MGGAATFITIPKSSDANSIWPGASKAAVSLTYDDGYDSQLDNVAPLLDELGLKATFFLTVENMDARRADWIILAKKGHEIGNHTMTHPCELSAYSAERFAHEQVEPAQRYFDANFGGPTPRCYAYPCGEKGLGLGTPEEQDKEYVKVLRPMFLAARTVSGGPNDPRDVMRRRYCLNASEPTYEVDDPSLAFAYVRQAIDNGHWAILVFHEVLDARIGEGDTSKDVHRAILERLIREPVWCAPMRTVFSYATGEK